MVEMKMERNGVQGGLRGRAYGCAAGAWAYWWCRGGISVYLSHSQYHCKEVTQTTISSLKMGLSRRQALGVCGVGGALCA